MQSCEGFMLGHLKKLPPKSFSVAPGDVIGGLIYVMDKPLGIEEGMVGISIDSEPYRAFVKQTYDVLEKLRKGEIKLENLDKETYPNMEQLLKRYQGLYNDQNGFANKSEKEIIDALLMDKVHEKKRHGASWKEFKNVFFSMSKYHDMKGLQSYYVNKGTGGLLFEAYKNKCEIKKNDHFATHIGKLIKDGNAAYMIKQDGKMALGGTGPGWRKMLKTNTGKSLQKLVNPFVILFTGGISALLFGIGMLGWRAFYLNKNKPAVSNSDAIIEALSTKMADKRGVVSQKIDTIEGTYRNGMPKIATVVTWAPGCRDLSGKLAGSTDFSSVIVTWDENDHPVKVDGAGNVLRTKDKNEKGEITSYEKIVNDKGKTKVITISKAEYDAGKMVSDDRIAGLGESLISFISMGDRDGIGKAGQNKAIMPLEEKQGNKIFQFFGIDFGKSYKEPNPIVGSLRDDFSFDNPGGRQARFVNYSMLYDNPLREKMKGVYLLAALRDKLPLEQKLAIAQEFENSGDKVFADKLRDYPQSKGGVNCDLQIIIDEIKKYDDLSKDQHLTQAQREQYAHYAQRLTKMKDIAIETDNIILDKFAARLNLTPTQIDLLDNIEKLTSRRAHTTSPDNNVQLNHLRVDRDDRCAWQLNDNKNDTFTLICEENQRQNDIKQRLQAFKDPAIDAILNKAAIDKGKLMIKDLTLDEVKLLSQHITEAKVAQVRELPYRSQEMRDTLHQCVDKADQKIKAKAKAKAKLQVELGPHQFDNPIKNAHIARRHSEPLPVVEHVSAEHIGFAYRPRSDGMSRNVMPVLTYKEASLPEIAALLDDRQNKIKFNIVDVKEFEISGLRKNKGIALTFKDPIENKEARVSLEQTPEGVRFNYPKDLHPSDFEFTSQAMCQMLAQFTQSVDKLDMSPMNPAQTEILQHAIDANIKISPHLKRDQPNGRLHI